MRIEVRNDTLSEIVVIHGKEELEFNGSCYDQSARSAGEKQEIFQEINAYWSTLPQNRQKEIFECYKQIYDIFETVNEPKRLHTRLMKPITQLLTLNPLEEIDYWVKTKTKITPPESMKRDYGPNDPREMTYLYHDYEQLTVLTIGLRPMVPVWGQYIANAKDEYGTVYKEYRALGLIAQVKDVVRSEPINRLERYIEASISKDSATTASVLGGLGTTELPQWVLAQAVVRRLSVVNVSGSDSRNNLISNIFRAVRAALESLNRKFDGAVREKRREHDSNEEDNSSIAENYKVKQIISDGDLSVLLYYTEKMDEMVRRIDPTVSMKTVMDCYRVLQANEDMLIHKPTLVLSQWLISPALPPRGVPSLNKKALLRVMAISQAVAWHWGYPDLAVLIGAQPSRAENEEFFGVMESRSRIPKEHIARLVELYPHWQKLSRQDNEKQANVACKAINLLTKELITSDWKVCCHPDLGQAAKVPKDGIKLIPPDIRAQLAELVIKSAENKQALYKPASENDPSTI